jgi:transcriptional regulator with XRE-family HTH domain
MQNKDIKNEINIRFRNAFKECESQGFISSRKSASEILGLSPQLLSEILNDRINVSTEVIHKFCSTYGVDLLYIFYGDTDIFTSTEEASNSRTHASYLDKDANLIKVKLSSSFWATDKSSFNKLESTELGVIRDKKLPDCFYIPNVFGVEVDAYAFSLGEPHMEPLLEQNMTVVAAKVSNKSNIVNGQVYVIDHRKFGIICRRLFWLDKEKGIIELVPDNRMYSSKETNLKEIENVYRVFTYLGSDLNKRSAFISKQIALK